MSGNPNIMTSKAVPRWLLTRKNTMTSFVHLDYSNQHFGATRVMAAIECVATLAQHIKRKFSATRSLIARALTTRLISSLLLSAIAAAVMVVGHQVMQTIADGHLFALWIGVCAVAFAALAAFASTARHLTVSAKAGLDRWSRNIALKRADERLWAMAKTDARLMADLQTMITRHAANHDESLSFVAPADQAGRPAQ